MIVEAFVSTDRPDRYLIQLTRLASQMRRHFGQPSDTRHDAGEPPRVDAVESSNVGATLEFAEGRCVLRVLPNGLNLRLEAEDEQALQRLQDGVGGRLQTLGTKDQLQVAWSGPASG